ncbi:MAG: ABC transporter ATP-binding protein [Planctomycetota bacterium]
MLKIDALYFKYRTGSFTIEVNNFSIEKGNTVLIRGYNGSGKTTFLKIIAGILKPQKGEISIEGKPIQKSNSNLYRKIGYLRQQPENFVSVKVKELISMGLYPYNFSLSTLPLSALKKCVRVLKKLDIYKLKNFEISDLSAGQLQMCFFGKIVVQDPLIFLLDEPFNNLDEKNTRIILETIKNLKEKGKIIIIATHRHSYYEIDFDKVYEFKEGKLEEASEKF